MGKLQRMKPLLEKKSAQIKACFALGIVEGLF